MKKTLLVLFLSFWTVTAAQAEILELKGDRHVDQATIIGNQRGLIEVERLGKKYFIPSEEIVKVLGEVPAGAVTLSAKELAAYLPSQAEPEASTPQEVPSAAEEAGSEVAEEPALSGETGAAPPLGDLVGVKLSWEGSGAEDERSQQLLARLSPEQARGINLKGRLFRGESFVITGIQALALSDGKDQQPIYRVQLYKRSNGRSYDLLLQHAQELNGWKVAQAEEPQAEAVTDHGWGPGIYPRAYLFTDAGFSQITLTSRQYSYYYGTPSYEYSVYEAIIGLGFLVPMSQNDALGASFFLQTGLAVSGSSAGSIPTGNQTQLGFELYGPSRRFDMKLYGVYEYLADTDTIANSLGGRLEARVLLY
jgi:hypothetical protein